MGGGETASHGARDGGAGGKKHGGLFLKSGGGGGGGAGVASAGGRNATGAAAPPVEYTMMLHPPLVVENLLPHAGDFELVDEVRERLVLWHPITRWDLVVRLHGHDRRFQLRFVQQADRCTCVRDVDHFFQVKARSNVSARWQMVWWQGETPQIRLSCCLLSV